MNKQPKPDSKKYTDLISEIQKGQIKIPKSPRFLAENVSVHWYDDYKQNHTFDRAVSEKPKTSRNNFKKTKND